MAFPTSLKVLGSGLTAVAEGLQKVPELQEQEEERQLRHQLRPLDLEQAQMDIAKTRREAQQPKVQALGQGQYAVIKPDGTYEVRTLGPQPLKDPATVARLKWIIEGLKSDDPATRELAEAELAKEQAPGLRADTTAARLKQSYQTHVERLKAKEAEVDKRLANATTLGNQRERMAAERDKAALQRQRERFEFELQKLEVLEGGRDYREELKDATRLESGSGKGTGTGSTADMTTPEAEARLKAFRTSSLYFPGKAAEVLEDLERTVARLKAEGRSHIGGYLTRKLKRLGEQLDRAAHKEKMQPRPQTTPPQSPQPGTSRPSSPGTGSGPSSGALPRGPQGPTPAMVEAYTRFYTGMSPEEAEVDLKATMAQDQALQARGVPSPTTEAKQQAYSRVFPDKPLTMQIPPPPATPPRSPQPQGPPPPAPPPQGRTGTATPPQQTPQAQPQAMLNPYRRYYETFDDKALEQEAHRLRRSDPGGMSVITAHRLAAVQQVREARQHAAALRATGQQGQEAPQPPPTATPQEAINHYRAQYQNLSTTDLLTEQSRLMRSDPFSLNARTSLRLSAITMILTQRQNAQTPASGAPGPQEPD